MPREEVTRNQRERLFGAAIAAVAEKGYEATTVADLVALSGVSRSDFYEHFADKRECVVAAAESLLGPALAAVRGAAPAGRRWARAAFDAFVGLVEAEPAAARVCFVELHAAGEDGERAADRAFDAFAAMVGEAAARMPGYEAMEPRLVRALVGGLRKVFHTRLYRGEEGELAALAPELWRWAMSVKPPPRPLQAPRRASTAPSDFQGYTPAERIARAVAAVTVEKGFNGMTTNDIAARASISLSTFYSHFADKQDAVLAALEMSGAQMMASVVPATRRASDWREGVRAVYEAMCAYLAAEPAMAQLVTIGVYAAGPKALARRDRVIDSLGAMLAPGFEENPVAPAVAPEAVGGAVYSLLRDEVRANGTGDLAACAPLATYVTLVPFVGPDEACAVANGEGGVRR